MSRYTKPCLVLVHKPTKEILNWTWLEGLPEDFEPTPVEDRLETRLHPEDYEYVEIDWSMDEMQTLRESIPHRPSPFRLTADGNKAEFTPEFISAYDLQQKVLSLETRVETLETKVPTTE